MIRRLSTFLVCVGFVGGLCAQPPLAADKALSRIAFGSCVDQDKPCPSWDAIGAFRPDVLLMLGDNIYADIENGKVIAASSARIQEKYKTQAGVPAFKAVRDAVPIMATWDDHDYGMNDAGVEWPHKDLSQTYFLDFWGVPKNDARRYRKGVYSAAIIGPVGKRVQIIMLDGRYYRSPLKKGTRQVIPPYSGSIAPYLPNTESGATMLGEIQWAWLEAQLRQPAELRILCSPIQVISEEHPFEKWANFPNELERLYRVIRDTKANGVVVLSGDRHLADLSCRTDVVEYPLFDVTSSGLNQGSKSWRPPEKNRYRIGGMPYGNNFGSIVVDWDAVDVKVTLQLRDDAGEVQVSHPLRLQQLKPRGAAAVAAAPVEPVAQPVQAAPPVQPPVAGEDVLTPAQAAKMIDKEVTVQFTPVSGRLLGQGNSKRLLLNSEKDFRDVGNFTIMLTGKAFADKYKDATFETFKDKTIKIKGKVKMYQNRPEIEVTDESQLTVVEK